MSAGQAEPMKSTFRTPICSVAVVAGALLVPPFSSAQADYLFRVSQFNGAGDEIEAGSWRCADAAVAQDSCTQTVMLVMDGRPQPVEMRFRDQGGRLQITMVAGEWLLQARPKKPLIFSSKGAVADLVDVWETRDHALPKGVRVDDLVFRPPIRRLASFALVVERLEDR